MTMGDFKPVEWAHATNIYEVNIRQYTFEGSFKAFARHLPRLRDMGVGTIWFMPITPIAKKNRKGALGSYYACSDYLSVNPEFGTLDDFKQVVKEAQSLGMKVIIDWVANHTGWDHVWTESNRDFYVTDRGGSLMPPFPEWEDTLKLNYDNPRLRKAMIDAKRYWVEECGIDGFRCDMAHLVPLDFWIEARTTLDKIKPLFWLAETEDANYHKVFDASYTWEFLHAMEKFWRKETDINGLDHVLHKYEDKFPAQAMRAFFTSNHDENSHSGSEYERMGDAAIPFAVLCATWRNSIPLVYSGQELPLKDKRLLFFDKDLIPWTEKPALHDFYARLFHLRATNPALRAGDPSSRTLRIDTSDNKSIFAFLRKNGNNEVIVLLNLSAEEVEVKLNGSFIHGKYRSIFEETGSELSQESLYKLSPWGYEVYAK